MRSSTGSALIAAFTEMSHANKLKEDQHKLAHFSEQIKKRRAKYMQGKTGARTFNDVINQSEKYKTIDFHSISFQALEERFGTSIKNGLTEKQAKERLEKYGPNKLSEKEGVHWTIKLLK